MRGTCPRIAFPIKDAEQLKQGQIVKLSKQVEIEITGLNRTKKGELQVDYLLRDQRPTLLRRTPQVHTPESDSEGYVPIDNPADIEAARLDSSYTHSPVGAIEDAGEAVPEVDQKLLSLQARSKWAERKATDKAEQQAREDARRLAAQIRDILLTQARSGVDSSPFLAELQRIAEQQTYEEEVA